MRIVCMALCLAAVARADDDATDLARRHYQSGSAYFEEGRWDDAVREFRDSYRLSPRVELLYNVAKCYEKKGDAARTVEAYRQYLAARPDAGDRAEIAARIDEMEKRVGRVRIAGAPDGALLFVDGAPVGRAPLGPVTATAGERSVEARSADGGAIQRALVVVVARGEVVATLPPSVREVVKEKLVTVDGPRWYRSRAGWALVGAGAAVAIAGAVMLGLARPTQDDAASASSEAGWRSGQDNAKALQWSGVAALAVGGALAATGAIVFVVSGRAEAPRVAPAAWLERGGGGLALGGCF